MNININGQSIATFLRGKKTYLCAGAAFVYFLGITHHWWNHDSDIDAILSLLGIVSGRAAIQKVIDALNAPSSPTAPAASAAVAPADNPNPKAS